VLRGGQSARELLRIVAITFSQTMPFVKKTFSMIKLPK
jgi:hypothetical protein